MNKQEKPLLNQKQYENIIAERPEFLEAMNNGEPLHRAIGGAALRAAEEFKPYTFEHNILNTLGNMEDYFDAQQKIDSLRRKNNTPNASNIPKDERSEYFEARETITHFNHVLRDTIEASINNNITYAELQKLITDQHNKVSQNEGTKQFSDMVRSTINGMRNELAVEMILINNGVDFEQGSEEDDSRGGDFIVNGVPIDIKASESTANHKKQSAEQKGYNPDTIIWSQITFEDYQGKLGLDPDTEDRIAPKLLAEIDKACGTDYAKQLQTESIPA